MTIATILGQKGHAVITLGPAVDLAHVAATLTQHRIGAVLVVDAQETLIGIVSERDLVRHLAQAGAAALAKPASEVMTRDLHTVSPETRLTEAMALMTDRRIRHLPVLEAGRLVGMVSIGDLVKARMTEIEQEAANLRAFVTAA